VSDSVNFLEILKQQDTQLLELEALLKEEHEILQQHHPEKLVELNQEKVTLLTQIDSTDKLFSNNAQFIADKKNGLYVDELMAIETTLLRCKDLNQVNGEIIHKSQISIERMRNALLEKRTKSTMTYDNKGKTSGGLNSLGIKA